MERISGHEPGGNLIASDGLDPSASEIVIAVVEHFPRLEQLLNVSRHCVLNKIVGATAGLRGEVFKFPFRVGGQMHFHAL